MTRMILEKSITRRNALRGGVACALASVVPYKLLGQNILQGDSQTNPSWSSSVPLQSELYAFKGAGQDLTAIAVTWPEDPGQDCAVRIHAGTKTWQFEIPAHGISRSQHHGDISLFIGDVAIPKGVDVGNMKAAVMEVDARAIDQQGASVIWAERIKGGSRQRIGSPFLSNILRDHEDLAKIYHASSPDQDKSVLLQPLSVEIARRLRVARAANPDSRARWLAYALLPDVLHYDSRRPIGFTFAAQNGRHPSESLDEVVNTMLAGGKPSGSTSASKHPSVQIFPYFEQPTTAV